MTKRINVILPAETVRTIDRLAKPGQRSQFITRAVEHYVATQSPDAVQRRLEQAALRDRDLDAAVGRDWFAVDQESWQRLDQADMRPQPATPDGETSTSPRSTRR